jgi:hypothetical protein
MQHYVAREIIRQRVDEMRAQASRDEAARQAREGRHAARDARRSRRAEDSYEARHAREARRGRPAGTVAPDEVPAPRVPDGAGDAVHQARDHAHAR